jgi:hypothetical protein
MHPWAGLRAPPFCIPRMGIQACKARSCSSHFRPQGLYSVAAIQSLVRSMEMRVQKPILTILLFGGFLFLISVKKSEAVACRYSIQERQGHCVGEGGCSDSYIYTYCGPFGPYACLPEAGSGSCCDQIYYSASLYNCPNAKLNLPKLGPDKTTVVARFYIPGCNGRMTIIEKEVALPRFRGVSFRTKTITN